MRIGNQLAVAGTAPVLEHVHAQLIDSDGYFVVIQDGFIRFEYPARSSGVIPREVGDRFID